MKGTCFWTAILALAACIAVAASLPGDVLLALGPRGTWLCQGGCALVILLQFQFLALILRGSGETRENPAETGLRRKSRRDL